MASLQTLPRADSTSARVPAALADVIARGLAANPRDRYQTAVEMGSALEAVYENLFRTGTAPVVPSPARSHARVAAWVSGGSGSSARGSLDLGPHQLGGVQHYSGAQRHVCAASRNWRTWYGASDPSRRRSSRSPW